MSERMCDYCGNEITGPERVVIGGEFPTGNVHKDCFELMVEEGLIERNG